MKTYENYLQTVLEYQKGYGLKESTRERNKYVLRMFFKWLDGKDLREVDKKKVLQYRNYLETKVREKTGRKLKPRSICLYMEIIKVFFDCLVQCELVLINPLEGVKNKRIKKEFSREIFTEEDMTTFLDNIPVMTAEAQRDRAMYELMYSSGLRISDVLRMEIEHLNMEERIFLVRGKGDKDRYVPFSEAARRFLIMYIGNGRKKTLKKIKEENQKRFVFLWTCKVSKYEHINKRFKEYLRKCGLDKKKYTLHSIRHATGTHLLSHGASIRYVQELLGHEDLKTTQLYARPTTESIKGMYKTYHPRENEYYKDIDKKYVEELKELKERLQWGRAANKQYKRNGTKKGFRNWDTWKKAQEAKKNIEKK